ncbi:Ubiquitin-like superfamily protein [Abeliophyllum distichum]|uniref:Ubiquitin-like superfamily protein n=1 Tax=Abeliophyllum distichum TaxID=126358 RepID=A0ABD1PC75_9LAMI
MEVVESEIHQVLVKFLDGKHKFFNFNTPSICISTLKHQIQRITSIPSNLQLLLSHNSRVLHDHQTLDFNLGFNENTQFPKTLDFDFNSQLPQDRNFSGSHDTVLPGKSLDGSRNFPVVVHLLLRLRGGKGGFGSLLRGAATKAGQKKTNNFDACRDMSGRRLRHVNAEKKLEEWRAVAGERKLEKMAEDYIKKRAKEAVKKGKNGKGDSSEKYVAKYREDSAKCMEEVERSVRESIKELVSSKRKITVEASESDSKRLKMWLGKKKLDDSDSEDMDDDDDDDSEEEVNEKSTVVDIGNHSDSSKETEGSSGSITGGKLDADKGSSGIGSEEEDTVSEESPKSGRGLDARANNSDEENKTEPDLGVLEESADLNAVEKEVPQESHSLKVGEITGQLPGVSSSEDEGASAAELSKSTDPEPAQEESVPGSVKAPDSDEPLNFDGFNSAAELEVLGLERLKLELQARGLKCGGTLQERAARLFLLKTTPLEMLPKKLFAKK